MDTFDVQDDAGEEDFGSEDSWESDVDSEAEIKELMQLNMDPVAADTGKQEYLEACKRLNIVPVAMFIAKLECEHINLRHHGLGVKGAQALSAALKVNGKIRSLNLGDNCLGDKGVQALSTVLLSADSGGGNTSLNVINLSENHLGIPGVKALCAALQENVVITDLSLKGNRLDERAAAHLAKALKDHASMKKLDLSYNNFSEESGRLFGEMVSGNQSQLLELNLKWNSLRAKGGMAVAQALEGNKSLHKVDLSWNGLGDAGAQAVSEALKKNGALTHLDISHNRIQHEGALSLAEGISQNSEVGGDRGPLSLEMSFNPMGLKQGSHHHGSLEAVGAIVQAMRQNTLIESVGLTNMQTGGSYTRGRASKFDPKHPDGHYELDLAQPWDYFIAETLYERMVKELGESWLHQKLNGVPLELPADGGVCPELEKKTGVLEFDYVTWKRGLEATFKLQLANPCDLFIAEQLLQRTQAAMASASGEVGESLRDCRLNDEPFEAVDDLPASGMLHLVYFSTKPMDEIVFQVSLDLSDSADKLMCLRLWERALTTPSDTWKEAALDGESVTLTSWEYPEVPSTGTLTLDYAVHLSIRPYDRGVSFSPPMHPKRFERLAGVLSAEALQDYSRVELVKQAAARNYFDALQVKQLLELISDRRRKLNLAVELYMRCIDPHRFASVCLAALDSEGDRQAVLDSIDLAGWKRPRRHDLR